MGAAIGAEGPGRAGELVAAGTDVIALIPRRHSESVLRTRRR